MLPSQTKVRVACQYCSCSFRDQYDFVTHARKKHPQEVNSEWIPCDVCNKKFPSDHSVQNHKNSVHSVKPKTKGHHKRKDCQFCGKEYSNASKFYHHANHEHRDLISTEWFLCDKCEIFFPTFETLTHHRQMSPLCGDKDIVNSTQCEFCPKTFSRAYIYFKHASTMHHDRIFNKWLKCHQCESYFPTQENKDNHVKMAHDPKPDKPSTANRVLCAFCPMSLYEPVQYYRHANKKHPHLVRNQWQPCNICESYFPSLEVVTYHKASAHRVEDAAREAQRLFCDFCPLSFSRSQRFIQHVNKKHSERLDAVWFRCEICSTYFPKQKMVINHQRIIHRQERKTPVKRVYKQRQCPFCPRKAVNSDTFVRHVNREHPELAAAQWHVCSICGIFYPTGKALKMHFAAVHKDVENLLEIKCQFCPKKFCNESQIVAHANEEHYMEAAEEWNEACPACNMFFPTVAMLQKHNDTSHDDQPCNFCDENFRDKGDLIIHANEVHLDTISVNWLSCTHCESFIPSEADLDHHMKTFHQVKTELDEEDVGNDDSYHEILPEVSLQEVDDETDHEAFLTSAGYSGREGVLDESDEDFEDEEQEDEGVDDDSQDESEDFKPLEVKLEPGEDEMSSLESPSVMLRESIFTCESCGKCFDRKKRLLRHVQKCHLENDNTVCDICGSEFSGRRDLLRHKREVHGESFKVSLSCDLCGKKFGKKSNLKKHKLRIHSDVKASKCAICSKAFGLTVDLKKHVVRVHKINPVDGSPVDTNKKDSNGVIRPELDTGIEKLDNGHFKCQECDKTFEKIEYARKHKKRLHTDHVKLDCSMCNKSFNMTAELTRHQKRVHFRVNMRECHLCNKTFADGFSLKTHVESVHAQIKYDCQICGKSFSSTSYLKRHIELVHLKSRSFECEHCGQCFSENHVLKRHITAVHLKARNFECEQCGQTFSENHVLKRHISAVHLKQRNHGCDQCGKSFSESHVLKRHIQGVHLKQRNFNCEVCGLTFSENHVLRRHLQVHMNKEDRNQVLS